MTCITNNPLLIQCGSSRVLPVHGGALDVLLAAKARVKQGYKLVSHPLAGSLAPGVNPYRSILVGRGCTCAPEADISILDRAIHLAEQQEPIYQNVKWDECSERDLQQIDVVLVEDFAKGELELPCVWN